MANLIIVDDDPAILSLLKALLSADHNVRTASDGAAVQAMVIERDPDLVVLDYHMPIINGLEVAMTLREQGIAFIFISGEADMAVVQDTIALGALAYILKPIEPKQCLIAVQAALKIITDKEQLTQQLMVKPAVVLLMDRLHISEDDAYQILRSEVRKNKTTIEEVAAEFIYHVNASNKLGRN